jgi:hypothetical protein
LVEQAIHAVGSIEKNNELHLALRKRSSSEKKE